MMEKLQHLKIPLEEIKLATNNFSDENFIAKGGFGNVYKCELTISGQTNTVAVKRLDRKNGQGDREFLMEIQTLACYRHENLIVLIGFCDESGEKILVYEHAKYGSLDSYLNNNNLSWTRRLIIALGAARGFNYLHNDVGPQHRVLHRDIKSANILLNENWEAKISDFGLSKIGPSNVEFTFIVTNACGTYGYIDPQYRKTGILTKESDVYSFGVVLFEILCGRLAIVNRYQDERRFLDSLAQQRFEQNRLHEIILPSIMNEMKVDSLNVFSMVAYECLKENRIERPTMVWIVEKLEEALAHQVNVQMDVLKWKANTYIVRVTYREEITKFPFRLLDGLAKLKKEVATRFEISHGSFTLIYKDKDGDMILIACDNDLIELFNPLRRPDDQTVMMLSVLVGQNSNA